MKRLLKIILLLALFPLLTQAEETLQEKLNRKIDQLDYKNTDIRDVVRSIATKYQLNIFVENNLNLRITLHLIDVRVIDALEFIVNDNNLIMEQTGNIFKISQPPPPKEIPKKINISLKNDRITADFENDDIGKVVRAIVENSDKNILLEQGTSGSINGILNDIPFETGFREILKNNGFELEKHGNIYIVRRDFNSTEQQGKGKGSLGRSSFFLNLQDTLISIEVRDASINQIVQEAASRLKKNIFIYGTIEGTISARADKLAFRELLDLLFQGSDYTYRYENGITLIGNKNVKGIATAELVYLNYLKADKVLEILPQSVTSKAEIKPIIEQNGLMVIGSRDVIQNVQNYVNAIDKPSPQILIEILVIDINNKKIRDINLNAQNRGNLGIDSSGLKLPDFFLPGLDVILDKKFFGKLFGGTNIGFLPKDFSLQVQALEEKGLARIVSRPQIATLNGYPADIAVGQTQYYKFTTKTPMRDPNQIYVSEYERFETVEANISLEIVPWVSSSGEITVEIHPDFKTPSGSLSPDVPPTIETRALNSTVRLKDGETIILGGLIRNEVSESDTGLPYIKDIPVLGNFFKSQNYNKLQQELIIYVTPHLYYGDE